MKTFIWNRDYEVVAVNTETVEQARELLKSKIDEFFDDKVKDIILNGEKHKGEPFGNYKNYSWDEETNNRLKSIDKEKSIIYRDPDIIIEENQAIIFDHSNE